jgi:glucose-6-phosphate dehydrogenase assembly protein OpcA
MSQPRQQTETVATEPIRVDVESIESELANLWMKAAEGSLPGITAPVARVILSNLLVYASSEQEANEAASDITRIAADHPTRSVIADAQPGEPGHELEADVSMLCNITERGRRLCGEEIRLHSHGLTTKALGTIMPVLSPDLPIYLWTPGEMVADDEVLRKLVHISDHWIIDSRRFSDWPKSMQLAISLGPKHEPPVVLHDFAWMSLSQWRELVAQHFDSLPAREYLRGISSLHITYRDQGSGRPSVESAMIAGWLIRQLGWQSPEVVKGTDGTWTVVTTSDGREITIRLIPSSESMLAIGEITIDSDLDGRHATFRSAHTGPSDEVSIESSAPDLPGVRQTVRLSTEEESDLLSRALDSPGKDVLYDRILPVLESLIRGIEEKP